MILGFQNKTAEDIFHGANTREARQLPQRLWAIARRKLDMIHAALTINDLRMPPGNRLEKLAGPREGQHSIRINDQYRVCFVFAGGNATGVVVVDYH